MDSAALCLSGGRDQSGVVISLQWELGRFFFHLPLPPQQKHPRHRATGLVPVRSYWLGEATVFS